MISVAPKMWVTAPPSPSVLVSMAAFDTTCQSAGAVTIMR